VRRTQRGVGDLVQTVPAPVDQSLKDKRHIGRVTHAGKRRARQALPYERTNGPIYLALRDGPANKSAANWVKDWPASHRSLASVDSSSSRSRTREPSGEGRGPWL